MLISFVLRLSPAALAAGALAGEVEHVETGERGQFRDAAGLAEWCSAAARLSAAVPVPRASSSATTLLLGSDLPPTPPES